MKIKEEVLRMEIGSVPVLEDMLQDVVRDTVREILGLTVNKKAGQYDTPNPRNIKITIEVLDEDN